MNIQPIIIHVLTTKIHCGFTVFKFLLVIRLAPSFLYFIAQTYKMESIQLVPVMHRGAEQILIKCDNIKLVNDAIKKIPQVKWSQTHKAWYMLLNKESYQMIHQALHRIATLNTNELHQYLLKKKKLGK